MNAEALIDTAKLFPDARVYIKSKDGVSVANNVGLIVVPTEEDGMQAAFVVSSSELHVDEGAIRWSEIIEKDTF